MRPPRTPSGKPPGKPISARPAGRPSTGKSGGKAPAGRSFDKPGNDRYADKPSGTKPAGRVAGGKPSGKPYADRAPERPAVAKLGAGRPYAKTTDRPAPSSRPYADRSQDRQATARPTGRPGAGKPYGAPGDRSPERAPAVRPARPGSGRPPAASGAERSADRPATVRPFGKPGAGKAATGRTSDRTATSRPFHRPADARPIPAPKLGRRQARTVVPSGTVNPHPAHASAKEGREPQRIAKLLARAGIASRREIERMIEEGRIAIDGVAIDTPATLLTSLKSVTVDGNPVAPPTNTQLFLYYKPRGLLTTERDPKGRPTIYDNLPPELPRVMPVGRLDLSTEGLLLLTTDGEFKRQLELPATGVERIYRARAYGQVTQEQLESLSDGVEIEGVRYGPIDANIERRTGANVWIQMRLREGKNREVRRVLEYLGLEVSRLIRIAYGAFELGDLQPGEVGEILQNQLVAFRQTLKSTKAPKPSE